VKLYLKGTRCESPKCAIERRPYPPGDHGRGRIKESEYLLQLLEHRLDNVVYRGGLAMSRAQARQLVSHGHFQIDGKKVDIPSYHVKPGSKVEVRKRSQAVDRIVEAAAVASTKTIPDWLNLEAGELRITVMAEPAREMIDVPVQEQMIVELYSK
jgi:small subunit ribosomal protein S4